MKEQSEAKKNYDQICKEISENNPDISSGHMFGKPCLKLKRKAFVAFFKDDMVFKLVEKTAFKEAYSLEGAKLWDPSGKKRAMQEWVQVPSSYADKWLSFAENAVEGVQY